MRSKSIPISESLPERNHSSDWKAYRHIISDLMPSITIPELVLADEDNRSIFTSGTSEIDIAELVTIRAALRLILQRKPFVLAP